MTERALELIAPYVARDDVIGAYLVGSRTRPFHDKASDYDIEIVVTDEAYAATSDEERHVFQDDHEFYLRPESELRTLADSTQDAVRYGYQHTVVLHDPEKKVEKALRDLGDLPGLWRHERLRVHWLDLVFTLGRARKTVERGGEHDLDVRLLLAEALRAAVSLLFVTCGSWPSTAHWSRQELYLLGVPEDLLERLEDASETIELETWRELVKAIAAFLKSERHTFHEDVASLTRWAYLTEEGKAAFERWA